MSREYQKSHNSKTVESDVIQEKAPVEAEKPPVKTRKTKTIVIDKISESEAQKLTADKPKRTQSEKQKENTQKLLESNRIKREALKAQKEKEQEQADYERLKKLESEGKIVVKVAPRKTRPNHALTKGKKILESKEEEVESEVDDVVAPLPSPKRERSISPAVRQATEKVNNLIQKLETRTQQFVNPYSALLEKKRAR
jgi:hypothetical protein